MSERALKAEIYLEDSYRKIRRKVDELRAEIGANKLIDASGEVDTDHAVIAVPANKTFHLTDINILYPFPGSMPVTGMVTVKLGTTATTEANLIDAWIVPCSQDFAITGMKGRTYAPAAASSISVSVDTYPVFLSIGGILRD